MNSGALRGALIAYGVAAFVYFNSKVLGSDWVLVMLGSGIAIQAVLFALRKTMERRELAVAPQVMQLAALVADGVTVLLFAFGTFRGMAAQVEAL